MRLGTGLKCCFLAGHVRLSVGHVKLSVGHVRLSVGQRYFHPFHVTKFCLQEGRGYFLPFGVASSPCLFKNDLCVGQVRKVKQWGLWFYVI